MADQAPPLDLEQARRRLAGASGKDYWRSLEELAGSEGFDEMLEREFPRQAGGWVEGLDRRHFLKLMGASLALAGLSGCAQQAVPEPIVPYTRAPEEIVPGRPLYFATAMPLAGYGTGLLVESHEGRPTKVEGNPDHPTGKLPVDSPGAGLSANDAYRPRFGPSNLFNQASILGLYDPDRAKAVTHLGDITTWEAFVAAMTERLRHGQENTDTELRIHILTGAVTSPTLAQQIRDVLQRFRRARWHVYEPTDRGNARIGARFAFGQEFEPVYSFAEADVILSLDADFLSCGPGHLRYVRDFASRRRRRQNERQARPMNRLYTVESMPSNTGAVADHRWPMRAAQVESFARAVARLVGVENVPEGTGPAHGVSEELVAALVSDLRRAGRKSLIIAGENQPPLVHALAHAINQALNSVGQTVKYVAPIEVRPPEGNSRSSDPLASLRQLVAAMENRQVDILIILDGNPVYTAPADLNFADHLDNVPFSVHLSLYNNETAGHCHWHIPEAHYLETWGDVRAYDGTASIIQPLIAPLYHGRSPLELLALLAAEQLDRQERLPYDIVRTYWRRSGGRIRELQPGGQEQPFPGDFETWWRRALREGLIQGTEAQVQSNVRLQNNWTRAPGVPQGAGEGMELVFRPDPTIFDGSFANNGWLQELPKPLSKLTWDNAAFMSPATAVRLGLATEQVVSLRTRADGAVIEAPVYVIPGHADNSVTVHLGYGRTSAGQVGTGIGFNAYRLRTAAAPWFTGGLHVSHLARTHSLVRTQLHHTMHGREIVRSGTAAHPPEIAPAAHEPRRTSLELPTLYPQHEYNGDKWGMSIDLSLCVGCNSCVIACQAENNIPVVGKDEVGRGREMHWLRVDNYYTGEPERPEMLKTFFQPVPCMHCENAPCEVVCPVGATVHSNDGLNDMVYNRCVGTRYCSNNCPYKVRRFNFLQYSDWATESLKPMRNPDVTVRSRGVMEKCTYCVQRIRQAQIQAQLQDREVRDGEIQTACQSACPAGAIIFGNLNGKGVHEQGHSKVAQLQDESRNYGLLYELNTRPRTTYLAALKNPNPDIERIEGGQR